MPKIVRSGLGRALAASALAASLITIASDAWAHDPHWRHYKGYCWNHPCYGPAYVRAPVYYAPEPIYAAPVYAPPVYYAPPPSGLTITLPLR